MLRSTTTTTTNNSRHRSPIQSTQAATPPATPRRTRSQIMGHRSLKQRESLIPSVSSSSSAVHLTPRTPATSNISPSGSTGKQEPHSTSTSSQGSSRTTTARQPANTKTTTTTTTKMMMTEGFTQQELEDLGRAFRLFDVEGTGVIEIGAFRLVLESLVTTPPTKSTMMTLDYLEQQQLRRSNNQSITPPSAYPHLATILNKLSNRSDEEKMDFEEYVALMASTTLQQRLQQTEDMGEEEDETASNCRHVFNLFDTDGKGYITVEDLHRIATELGESDMTSEELQEMIDRASSKKTGRVTLKEFSKMMTLNLFQNFDETIDHEDDYH